ncbi:HEAT repeat domain-containing protein [Aestuariibacter sp. AA17]|uniref:HEAT repeat domain-containing protein n=1 Tax=Fluctibacter corallii TaxID=2984329 RepID=A0ABT3ACI8_9ALTE|nr:HEAT repeat domain-containing protein [Aestuariibacter sp. AA17]MCV2886375.1 HEAT repeat domain-containing protein [Aestuariibacter sp. AA17]
MRNYVLSGLVVCALLLAGYFLFLPSSHLDTQHVDSHSSPISSSTDTADIGATLKYRFDEGVRLSYDLHYQVSGVIDLAALTSSNDDVNQQAYTYDAKARIDFAFQSDSQQGWKVLGFVSEPDVMQNGQQLLSTSHKPAPFAFDMSENGVLTNLTVNDELTGDLASVVLEHFQVLYPTASKAQWKTRERDSVGRYHANYQLQGSLLTKQKSQYIDYSDEMTAMSWEGANINVKVNHFTSSYTLSAEHGWLDAMSTEGQVETYIDGVLSDSALIRLTAKATTTPDELVFVQPTQQRAVDARSAMAKYYQTDPELNAMAEGLDSSGAIEKYTTLFDNPETESLAMKFIINYLRLHPDAAFVFVDLLDQQGFVSHDVSLRLWYALSEAGHREAQQALANVITRDNYRSATKNRALSVIHDFEYPTDELVDATWQATQQLDADSQRERSLGTMAILATGSLGDPVKRNPAQVDKVASLLRNDLYNTDNTERQQNIIAAMGNAANPSFVKDATAFLESDDNDVREESLLTLLKLPTQAAQQAFYDGFNNELSEQVKYNALRALSSRDSDDMATWAASKVVSEKNSYHRVLYIEYLGRTLEQSSQNEDTLRALLERDDLTTDEKSAIYRYISPD